MRINAEKERVRRELEEEFNAEQEAKKELARREAARRNLLPFVMYFNDKYEPGWVHADICRRLEKFSRDVAEGKSPRLMLFLPPRSGKQLADSTPILTVDGWKTHGELRVGDHVFHPSGKPTRVVAVSEKTPSDYVVYFGNGDNIRCHANHEWVVWFGGHEMTIRTIELFALGLTETPRVMVNGGDFTFIDGVVQLPNGEVGNCIQVESSDGLYCAGRTQIATHNSEIASKTFPAWHLGHYPHHDVIACSYNAALAMDFSRKVRGLVQDERYHNIFPTRMDESSQSAERWNTSAGGGYVAAGVQGPITGRGAHCFPAGTLVTMADGTRKPIEKVVPGDTVLSYDTEYDRREPQQVVATQSSLTRQLCMVSTDNGKVIRCTPDHRFFTQRRPRLWTPAWRLDNGYLLVNDSGLGEYVTGAEAYTLDSATIVYDIQVERTQCFFADGLLVHNCAIIDDPLKDRESAESEVTRQAIKDWYSSTLYTRLAPGGGILIIHTRWHSDDLGGWLLEQMKEAEQEMAETGEWPSDADRWEVVKYPAVATHDEQFRKAGEALHPARYPIEALNRIRRTLIPRDWEALYQQNPVSADGDYFKKEYFRTYEKAPDMSTLRVYAAWDLAIGQKTSNDFTCGVVVGIDRDNDIWVLHRYYGRWAANELIDKFFECQRVYNPVLQGIEDGQISMTLEPFIISRINESRQKFNYIKLKTRGNDKQTRARPIQGRMEQGRVHFPASAPWFHEMQNEMLAFPSGKHDDQVDALAWIGQMILMLAPEREKRPPPKKSWRDRLRATSQRQGLSHMAS
ncbi:phage terminase large subunit [Spirabiliibacterium mucosae]|uniref:phage terminase large subunit n=1 Tax=Spirabiliibacterium mucosae TaxID=28156 RepID=UPI001AACCFB6|nr:phage terminase large subunit [Spirabiliibacterium mucosae]